MDDYFRRTEELPTIDPLTAYDDMQQFPELLDAKTTVCRVSTEVDFLQRQFRCPGMYPIPPSPVPTTFGFVPYRPTPTFRPKHPAGTSPATGSPVDQGSFNSHLTMVGSALDTSPSSGNSLPCVQRSPASQQNASISTQQGTPNNSQITPPNYHNIQPQNVAPTQPSASAPQSFQQAPVVQQQQSLLLQPPLPGSNAAPWQQGQPHFTQPRVSPQHNPLGNQGNCHHLEHNLILLLSLSFQLQQHR